DPASGKPAVHSVAFTHPNSGGPDLIVGYYPGYRSSWQTALGAVPRAVIEDNKDEWRGDHCIAAQFVPGVLLSNRRSRVPSPEIEDLTVTILEEFGVASSLEGRSIF